MKFTIQREKLLRLLQLVTGVVERRQTLPVLANLLVRAADNKLEITGTDLEVELVAECEAEVEQEGEATLPARKLADIWRSLDEGAEVTLTVEGDRATVRSGRSRFPRGDGGPRERLLGCLLVLNALVIQSGLELRNSQLFVERAAINEL